MKEIRSNILQSKILEHINKHQNASWTLSFNTKLGDTIIFNFTTLSEYKKKFKKNYVVSPFVNVLNPDIFDCYHLDLNIDWSLEDVGSSFKKLTNRVLDSLYLLKEDDFIFVDTGSIGVMLWNFFSDRNISLTENEERKYHSYIESFMMDLRAFIEEVGAFYVFWRNPIAEVTWGKQNFSFSFNGLGTHLPQTFLKDNDSELLKYVGSEVTVYKIIKTIYQYLFGIDFLGELFAEDFRTGPVIETVPNDFFLININTGSLKKREDFGVCLYEFVSYLCMLANKNDAKYLFYELEPCWDKSLRQNITNLLSTSLVEVVPVAQKKILPTLMLKASSVITHCSGFSHLSAIYNKNVITFTMKNSVAFINERNPWAPQTSISLREEHFFEDCNTLFNLARLKTKKSE
jgi:hypothetical protein